MKYSFTVTIGLLMSINVLAQGNTANENYQQSIEKAKNAVESNDFRSAAQLYTKAFSYFDGKAYPDDRYEAARTFAMSLQADTAFYHLFRLANDSKFKQYDQLINDEFLNPLHQDARWNELVNKVKHTKEEAERYLDKELMALLEVVYEDDQKYRKELNELEDKYGWESAEVSALWMKINKQDSINLQIVSSILDEKGWLGPKVVGDKGNNALFLVIQHADIEVQEKYLPLMRKAVENGNARGTGLALLEDRVALRNGKKQIYGSQIGRNKDTGEYYVLPLEDPDKVDERRAAVGLGSMQEYIQIWGLNWDVEAHKEQLENQDN